MSSTDDTLISGNSHGAYADDAPPVDEEDEWVLPPPRRRGLPRLTAGLVVALVAVGAFIAGVEIEKGRAGTGTATGAGGGAAARLAARTGAAGSAGAAGRFGAAAGAGGGATIGQVKTIEGTSLYVTSFTGNVVKVKTSPTTRFSKTQQLTVQGVKPGDTVVVQGTQAKDGSIAATSVSIGGGGGFTRGAGAGGGFGAGAGARGGFSQGAGAGG